MKVAYATLDFVSRPVGHPSLGFLVFVVVRRACAEELVGAGKILHRLEVLGDSAEAGVEDGPLQAVGEGCITGDHQIVADGPCVVGDIAGFV